MTIVPTPIVVMTSTETIVITPTGVMTPTLSKQPDRATFAIYFKKISLAELPIGAQAGPGSCPTYTSTFTGSRQMCVIFEVIKLPAQVTEAIYDTQRQEYVRLKAEVTPPISGTGERIGCSPVTLPPGSYEYRAWVSDVLVAVLPFEVR
ncbi:MAG: hypothetical protein HYU29_05975 [Chloroflexi bacterium]|nr:hypothetical protein [Chloroflexota bacterium]